MARSAPIFEGHNGSRVGDARVVHVADLIAGIGRRARVAETTTAQAEDCVRELTGRWRIVEMDLWEREDIDLVGPGFIEFAGDRTGEFGFIAVRGSMDCRSSKRDGRPFVEFSWDGEDEGDQVGGRGWAVLSDDDTLTGHLYFHMGDDSGFRATPFPQGNWRGRR